MPYAVFEKKINLLSQAQQQSVFDYINFLLFQNNASKAKKKSENKRSPGGLTGKFWMADDFDETPDCFAEYMP